MRLDDLPREILQYVSEYLCNTSETGLRALSCVSHCCRVASIGLIVRQIRVNVSGAEQLRFHVVRWSDLLDRYDEYAAVRKLSICASSSNHSNSTQDSALTENPHSHGEDDPLGIDTYGVDIFWKPVAELIRKLAGLTTITWAYPEQVPPCVLATLNASQRLHIEDLVIASLPGPVLKDHEANMLSSSSLSSIRLSWCARHDDGSEDYGLEALQFLCAKLAPSLTDVTVDEIFLEWTPMLMRAYQRPRTPWPGFVFGKTGKQLSQSRQAKGRLQRLKLTGYGAVTAKALDDWHAATDFAIMRRLELESLTEGSALSRATAYAFDSLSQLALNLDNPVPLPGTSYTSPAMDFLRSLSSLEHLCLSGNLTGVDLKAVLSHHCQTLRCLWLSKADPSTILHGLDSTVDHICNTCTQLEELHTLVSGVGDYQAQLSVYQALGSMPHLRVCGLTFTSKYFIPSWWIHTGKDDANLVASESQSPDTLSSSEGQPQQNRGARGAPSDGVSANVARAIFRCINNAKPAGAAPIQQLQLGVGRKSRSWSVRRSERDDQKDVLMARRMQQQ